jgi:flagellar basal-body rod protein FlgB
MRTSLDHVLAFHETALRLRAQRQQLLASNIANADTPNYKARDFDFPRALQTAIGKVSGLNTSLSATSPKHIVLPPGNALGAATTAVQYRTVQQASVDSNTVDMDLERNQFVDNAIRYEASLTMVSGQVKSLLTAIQG